MVSQMWSGMILGMMDSDPLVHALDQAGYRLTEPRRAVADLIAAREGHFTAQDLIDDAKARRLGIGRATIFRALDLFTELNVLERLDPLYGPRPGHSARPVVMVLDNGPIHTSKLSRAALAERPWLTIEWLPKYAPELNDIERSWRDLKRHFLAHRTFRSIEQLDSAIATAVDNLNAERNQHSCHDQRIAA